MALIAAGATIAWGGLGAKLIAPPGATIPGQASIIVPFSQELQPDPSWANLGAFTIWFLCGFMWRELWRAAKP